jgi:hypothetical protein
MAEDLDLAAVGEDQAQGALQGRRLAGAVRPEVAEDLSGRHRQRDALEDLLLGDKPTLKSL